MRENLIHKVHITPEAVFDYEETLELGTLPKNEIKAELEEYIDYITKSGYLNRTTYHKCKYYDEHSDRMLMLFIYKAERFGIMQTWEVKGICIADEWNETLEDEGIIRQWCRTEIENLHDEKDWVIQVRIQETIKDTRARLKEEFIREVRNAFICGRDKETAAKMALLQCACFRARK